MKSVIYIGMDVHSKTFSLCAYNTKTRIYSNIVRLENRNEKGRSYGFLSYDLPFNDLFREFNFVL